MTIIVYQYYNNDRSLSSDIIESKISILLSFPCLGIFDCIFLQFCQNAVLSSLCQLLFAKFTGYHSYSREKNQSICHTISILVKLISKSFFTRSRSRASQLDLERFFLTSRCPFISSSVNSTSIMLSAYDSGSFFVINERDKSSSCSICERYNYRICMYIIINLHQLLWMNLPLVSALIVGFILFVALG